VPPRITVNAFLVHIPDRLVLVDGGCGGSMGPDMGRFGAHLAAMGVAPGDVDTVLATHLHPDHIGGLVDGAGKALFPNAELVAHEIDVAFWADPQTLAQADDSTRGYVVLAQTVLATYRDRLKSVKSGEVLPGITIVPEPGHTPGHSGWMFSSGNQSLLIWGDIVHMPGVQFARPGAGMGFDVDGDQAIVTRQRIFDMVTTDRLAVAGMHLDFPCFGHVAKASEGFAFIPEVWRPAV
jgi:glyoxylase-like metal-dependent hydrolase (beta-lactamase superfamily II)